MGVEPSRSSIQDGSRYDDVGAVGWVRDADSGRRVCDSRRDPPPGSPYLGRSAVVELVAGLGEVLHPQLVGLLHLLYLLGPRLGL